MTTLIIFLLILSLICEISAIVIITWKEHKKPVQPFHYIVTFQATSAYMVGNEIELGGHTYVISKIKGTTITARPK